MRKGVLLEWLMNGGGDVPVFTVIRLYVNGRLEALVANSWMNDGIRREAGVYEMQLGEKALESVIRMLKQQVVLSQFKEYRPLYADSGAESLGVYYDGILIKALWGSNNADELPRELYTLRNELSNLFNTLLSCPRQVLNVSVDKLQWRNEGRDNKFRFELNISNPGSEPMILHAAETILTWEEKTGDVNRIAGSEWASLALCGKRAGLMAVMNESEKKEAVLLMPGGSFKVTVSGSEEKKLEGDFIIIAQLQAFAELHWEDETKNMELRCFAFSGRAVEQANI